MTTKEAKEGDNREERWKVQLDNWIFIRIITQGYNCRCRNKKNLKSFSVINLILIFQLFKLLILIFFYFYYFFFLFFNWNSKQGEKKWCKYGTELKMKNARWNYMLNWIDVKDWKLNLKILKGIIFKWKCNHIVINLNGINIFVDVQVKHGKYG